jgi:soluble lytic murein transglycosylase
MPAIKNLPALPLVLAFASVIALSGHLAAAPKASDAEAKQAAAKKQPAKKDAGQQGQKASAKKTAPTGAQKPAATAAKKPAATAAKKPAATAAKKPAAPAPAKKPAATAVGKAAGKTTAGKKAPPAPTRTSAAAGSRVHPPLPRPRPGTEGSAQPMLPGALTLASAETTPALAFAPIAAPVTTTTSSADLPAVKQALDLIRKGKISAAHDVKNTITDPAGRKLIEWVYLRSPYSEAGFDRYAAFIRENPSWPSIGMIQRRAEGALWDDKRPVATIRAFFAENQPKSGKGRLALARALLAQGDEAGAQRYAREAWRRDPFSAEVEQQALEQFGAFFTAADHRARMHRMLFAEEEEGAMRAAKRLGASDIAVAKARAALNDKSDKAGALLDAVPAEARQDPNYVFGRIQWLRRQDKIAEAGQLMLSMPRDASLLHDTDEWWVERRLLARKLIDIGDPRTAYRVASQAALPEKESNSVDHEFTAGWIALRFLNDARTALTHFSRIPERAEHASSFARAHYWQGRALEALSRNQEARVQYQAAARFSSSYYGQIARSRLGINELSVRRPANPTASERAALRNLHIVRAVEILYGINERDLVTTMAADLADRPIDHGALVVIGEICAQHRDARAMLYLGKTAIARGHPFDHLAFPDVGIPNFTDIAPPVERSVVFAIARQESAFNPRVVSSAKAMGLMQVTPAAGRYIAKRHGAKFDQKRLLNDPAYNAQFGAAELSGLLQDYRGSYILTFAGYNAGRGRIKEWVARYGDPRDPQIDPIDWVELIPFSETRNYVQRVMENMQVYRVRLGGGSKLMIEADLRRGAAVAN